MRSQVLALVLLGLVACSARPTNETPNAAPTSVPPHVAPPVDAADAATDEANAPAAPYSGPHVEAVHVQMTTKQGESAFCTGILVSKTTAITAAHCIDPEVFVSWEIVAALVPERPRSAAAKPLIFGGGYTDVANPDVGILTLATPIELPVYPALTDVVAQVEGGSKPSAAAVVRTVSSPNAPLTPSKPGPVTSTAELGYVYGFGVPLFSKAGDSGAGLFLVEDGVLTHKLIGIARQPEPERGVDHFTRIDTTFVAWLAKVCPGC